MADERSQKRKRVEAAIEQSSHCKAKKDKNESIFKDLHKKHSAKYDMPRLWLWSRMVAAGIHDDYNEPPDIPPLLRVRGHPRRQCLIVIVEQLLLLRHCKIKAKQPQKYCQLGYNFKQLRYLQPLLDDGILSEVEYTEQKWYSRI